MVATGKRWQAEVTSKHIIFVPRKISWTYLSKIFQQFYAVHMSILTGKVKLILKKWSISFGLLAEFEWGSISTALILISHFGSVLLVLFVCPELGVLWRKTGGERGENTWIYQQRGILRKHEQGQILYLSTLSKNFNGALSDSSYSYIEGVPKKRNNSIFQLWTLFWSLFDLLMTLTPYKHLPKFCFMF